MICHPCREKRHEDCRGGSWCDCQHQPVDEKPARDQRAADGRADG